MENTVFYLSASAYLEHTDWYYPFPFRDNHDLNQTENALKKKPLKKQNKNHPVFISQNSVLLLKCLLTHIKTGSFPKMVDDKSHPHVSQFCRVQLGPYSGMWCMVIVKNN